MKNKLYGWLIAFFSLVLLHPSGLLAEGAPGSANNTPKTAEELLVSIRDFLANPDMDGALFVEKITGVNKADWGPVSGIQTGFAEGPNVRLERYVIKEFKQPMPTVPYRIFTFYLEEHTHALMDVEINPHRGAHGIGDPDYLLEITPELTRKILGPPNQLYVTSPHNEFSGGRYDLCYTYLQGRYEFEITFWAKGDNDLSARRERAKHTSEQIRQERGRRKLFDNHKDFLALTMDLHRMK